MPGLVGQNPVAPFTTPVDGDDLLAAVVVSHDNSTRAHTRRTTPMRRFISRARRSQLDPVRAIVGRKWITTDGLRVYYDTGGAWSEIAYLPLVGGTLSGDITIPNGNSYFAKRNTGGAAIACWRYDVGTDDLSTVMGGTIWRVRDTGAGVLMSLSSAGALSLLSSISATAAVFAAGASVTFGVSTLGESTAPGNLVTGSVAGDVVVRTNAKSILFTVDGGASIAARVTSAGVFQPNKIKGGSAAPSASIGAALGAGGAVGVVVTGSDTAGKVVATAGNAGVAPGTVTTVTFNVPYATAPFVVLHYDNHSSSTALPYGVANITVNGFDIILGVAPTVGQQFAFYFQVIQ
jgi:hypothetical protein